jgi:iron-sulfur cluster repair protein YtfE (RIC family)
MEKVIPSSMKSISCLMQMSKKIKEAGTEVPELNEEFAKLREITNNYTVPDDVCESYEAVYNMLAELDKAYQAMT